MADLKRGFQDHQPSPVTSYKILTASYLSRLLNPGLDPKTVLKTLKTITTYSINLQVVAYSSHPSVNLFWEVAAEFGSSDWEKYLVFVSGRKRIGHEMSHTICIGMNEGQKIPSASTCDFTLFLGDEYEGIGELRRLIFFAFENCKEIFDHE